MECREILVTRNAHMQYESHSSSGLKVMIKVKVFWKWSRSLGQNYGMMWTVLFQGIDMWNMKVLSFALHKLWTRLKFLIMDDDDNNDDDAGAMKICSFRHGELKVDKSMSIFPSREQWHSLEIFATVFLCFIACKCHGSVNLEQYSGVFGMMNNAAQKTVILDRQQELNVIYQICISVSICQ